MSNLKTNATAGAPTPNGRQKSSAFLNAQAEDTHFADGATPLIDLDARLDDMIAIADLTGATLDDVVRLVGQVPEPIFASKVNVLAALAAPPASGDLPGLLREHRAATDRIAEAETDADIAEIDAQIDAIERQIMSTPAPTPANAYAKMLAIFPEIRVDLQAPEHDALRAEIGGEV